jgi:transposase InsO family protein
MRIQFIADYRRGLFSFAELCRRYGVSRKTGYKWVERYELEGAAGLDDRSHRTRQCPHATTMRVQEALLEERRRHPTWGAEKLLILLRRAHPLWRLPSCSTAHEILKRHGMVTRRRRHAHFAHPGQALVPANEPNAVWTTDFKGEFRTRDRVYCYPLTILDLHSRFLIECKGCLNTSYRSVRPCFERRFREFGLPLYLRSDNGAPFAAHSRGRLTRFSVWLIHLGVIPQLIEPAQPQQNGAHERMHRTLKSDATRPPERNCSAQQRRFNEFRTTYNTIRPHQSLDQRTPAELYQPSPRSFPRRLPTVEYPEHFDVRRVSLAGTIRWKGRFISVSSVLGHENIGLEAIDNGIWALYFGPVRLGTLDERTFTVTDL